MACRHIETVGRIINGLSVINLLLGELFTICNTESKDTDRGVKIAQQLCIELNIAVIITDDSLDPKGTGGWDFWCVKGSTSFILKKPEVSHGSPCRRHTLEVYRYPWECCWKLFTLKKCTFINSIRFNFSLSSLQLRKQLSDIQGLIEIFFRVFDSESLLNYNHIACTSHKRASRGKRSKYNDFFITRSWPTSYLSVRQFP